METPPCQLQTASNENCIFSAGAIVPPMLVRGETTFPTSPIDVVWWRVDVATAIQSCTRPAQLSVIALNV